MTPGGCSTSSGRLGSTGASSSLPTSSAASRSPGASPKYTVVTGTPSRTRLPVSVTFHSASRSRVAVPSAAPGTSEMLNTRTSALACSGSGEGSALEVALLVVVLTTAESPSSSSSGPRYWSATSRNTTPRKSSTMTMARSGSPEESRWFIGGKPNGSGDVEAEPPGRLRLLPARPHPSQPLDQHRVCGQRFGTVHQRVQHLVVPGRRHREELFDGVFLGPCVFPPLAFEGQYVVFAAGQPVRGFGVVSGLAGPRDGAIHIALWTLPITRK